MSSIKVFLLDVFFWWEWVVYIGVVGVKTLLAGNGEEETKWAQFKIASGQFQAGAISADQYFATCLELFGVKLALVFPEFLTLLPDIPKQHALMTLYNTEAAKSKVRIALSLSFYL
jgi:hypothetical protein